MLPGNNLNGASDLSGDGTTLVGYGTTQALRWRAESGSQGLGFLPGLPFSGATGVSRDGSVVSGNSTDQLVTSMAFRWTQSTGMLGLPNFDAPRGLSGDGTTVVGFTDPLAGDLEARRWTATGGTQTFAPFNGTPFGLAPLRSFANASNSDGSLIVGSVHVRTSLTLSTEADMPLVWTPSGGTQVIPLSPSVTGAIFHDVTPDGLVAAGITTSTTGAVTGFLRWTNATGYQTFAGVAQIAGPVRTSADGNAIIAGLNYWSPGTGVITIQQLLTQSGCNFTGWTITGAVGISDDGRTIAGNGTSPTGQTQAWITTVPSPISTIPLVVLGATAVSRRRR